MTTDPSSIQRVGQVALTVRDLPAAVAFYRDVVGLRLLFEVPGMAFFDTGNLRLLIGLPPKLEDPVGNSILYYQVADIAAAHARMVAAGAESVGAPHVAARLPDHELWLAFLRDPFDNTFALMSEVRAG